MIFAQKSLADFCRKNPSHMSKVKKIKFFKTLQEVFFTFLHVSDDPGWVILTSSWNAVSQVTVCHKVMKLNKISPIGRLSKFSNGSHRVDLFELQYQITSSVNKIHDGAYLKFRFMVTTSPVALG